MNRSSALRGIAAMLAGALLSGCDRGPSGPIILADLVIVSGDQQTAKVGTRLPAPLVVKVVDDSGDPVRGVHIAWQVVIGSGTISSARTVTGKDGQTSITATLTVGGQSAITATVDEAVADVLQVYFVADAT